MKKISGEIFGYVIRHPGSNDPMRYIVGEPEELKAKFYEGFNPVCALVPLDRAEVIDMDKPSGQIQRL